MRLIDADSLIQEIDRQYVCSTRQWIIYKMCEEAIRHTPTVEAVPVVRCRDCKYYEVGQNKVDAWSACYAHIGRIIETWDDNFCGWAERKEE